MKCLFIMDDSCHHVYTSIFIQDTDQLATKGFCLSQFRSYYHSETEREMLNNYKNRSLREENETE